MYTRVLITYKKVFKLSTTIGRYFSDAHTQPKPNPKRFEPNLFYKMHTNNYSNFFLSIFRIELLKVSQYNYNKNGILEGLDSLKYRVHSVQNEPLFKKIYVSYSREY